MVPPRDLRAGPVYRVRRQDDSRACAKRWTPATTRARRSRRRSSSARCSARPGRCRVPSEDTWRSIDRPPASRSCGSAIGIFFIFEGHRQDPLVHRHVAAGGPARGLGAGRAGRIVEPLRIWSASRCPYSAIFARLVPLGEITSGAALVAGIWTPLFAFVAFFMALQLPVRQRRACSSASILTSGYGLAGARVYAGAGCGRRAAAVEHWRFSTAACHESKKQLTSATITVTSMIVIAARQRVADPVAESVEQVQVQRHHGADADADRHRRRGVPPTPARAAAPPRTDGSRAPAPTAWRRRGRRKPPTPARSQRSMRIAGCGVRIDCGLRIATCGLSRP